MTVGFSDGKSYETEMDYHLDRPMEAAPAKDQGKFQKSPADIIQQDFESLSPDQVPHTSPTLRDNPMQIAGNFMENVISPFMPLKPVTPKEFGPPALNPVNPLLMPNLKQFQEPKPDEPKREDMLIIRHGATDYNLGSGEEKNKDYIRGHLDVPLNEDGRQEAAALGEKLKDKGIKNIVTSDLSRASDTAQAIGKTTGAKIYVDPRLRPWDLGDFQGKDSSTCRKQIEGYCLETPDKPVPNGESFNDFKGRVSDALIDAAQQGMDAVVTHHRVDRLEDATKDDGFDHSVFMSKGDETGSARTVDRQDMVQRLAMAESEDLYGRKVINFPSGGGRPSEGAAKGPAEIKQFPEKPLATAREMAKNPQKVRTDFDEMLNKGIQDTANRMRLSPKEIAERPLSDEEKYLRALIKQSQERKKSPLYQRGPDDELKMIVSDTSAWMRSKIADEMNKIVKQKLGPDKYKQLIESNPIDITPMK